MRKKNSIGIYCEFICTCCKLIFCGWLFSQSVLDDQLSSGQEHEASRVRTIHMSSIPDTLYMVEDPQYIHQFMANTPNIDNTVDIVSGTIPGIKS